MWHIQEIGAMSQQQRPVAAEERVVGREIGSISITKVKNRGIRRPRANKKNVTENIGTIATSTDGDEPKKRMRRDHERGVQPRLYNPLSGGVPSREFTEKLSENLQSINSDALICKILSDNINWDDMVETKYGQFPKNSTVGIQQKLHNEPSTSVIPENPPSPTACNINSITTNEQTENEFSRDLRPQVPIRTDQDFQFFQNLNMRPNLPDHSILRNDQEFSEFSHLNMRPTMQEHGYDPKMLHRNEEFFHNINIRSNV